MFGVPRNFAIGYAHNDNLPLRNIALQYLSRQLQEGVFWWFPALSEDQNAGLPCKAGLYGLNGTTLLLNKTQINK